MPAHLRNSDLTLSDSRQCRKRSVSDCLGPVRNVCLLLLLLLGLLLLLFKCNQSRHLNCVYTLPDKICAVNNYLHLLSYFYNKEYGVFEQASHTDKVTYLRSL